MTTPPPDRTNDYLWDPTSSPAPEVQDVERMLEPLTFEATTRPLIWPEETLRGSDRLRQGPPTLRAKAEDPGLHGRTVRGGVRRWAYRLAAAAAVALAIGWSISAWRFSWPDGRAWSVESASPAMPRQFAVGSVLDLPGATRARVDIARIGTMQIEGGSRVTLRYTQGIRHRLTLDRGTVRVRTWAPPGSVLFQTPTGDVIDLGCEFDLTAEETRSIVRVRSGWVQLDNGVAEALVPAGAASEMRRDRAPGVAVYEDARPEFAAAVRGLESGAGDRRALVDAIVASARARDMYTLLMLAERQEFGSDRLLAAAADLWPPPRGVTVNGILRGDRDALGRWRETLPLPPPKSWLRNWRDALPEWLVGPY